MTDLRGSLAATTIVLDAEKWVDAGTFRRAVFELEVRQTNLDPHIMLQTSDALDEAAFVTMVDHPATAVGTFLYKVDTTSTVPLLRYVRWRIGGATGGDWQVNVRILAAFKGRA